MNETQVEEMHAVIRAMQARIVELESSTRTNPPTPQLENKTRPNKPPSFSGRGDVDSWIFTMDTYFDALNECNPASRVSFAATYLIADAALWWRTVMAAVKDDNDEAFLVKSNWKEFCTQLTLAFRPTNSVQLARDRLSALHQKTSVQAYTAEFRTLALRIPDLSGAESLDRYIRGLKFATRVEVSLRNPTNLNDAICIAERYDRIKYENRVYPHQPPNQTAYKRNPHPGPQPMDIDATRMNPNREHRQRNQLCYYCGRPGHFISICPTKPQHLQATRNSDLPLIDLMDSGKDCA
jgi:hypothetical protein